MSTDSLENLKSRLQEFAKERDWDQFHSPKNLSMALIAEAAELVECFQWLSQKQSSNLSPEKLKEVELELADILIYLVRISDRLGVDLIGAAGRKIDLNGEKYPVEVVKGNSKKYSEY